MNTYFELEKQVRHLLIYKSMIFSSFEEWEEIEKMLRDNNYRNFVSCSKIKQVEFFEPNLKMYKPATFSEWSDYFEMDCRVSGHLMKNLVKFERTINSRISHYISEMMIKNQFSNFEKNTIIQLIQSSQRRRIGLKPNQKLRRPYTGERTWEFLPKMTFGEMKQVLFWLLDQKKDVYLKVVQGYTFLEKSKYAKDRIDEINRLRNNLAHFRPLNVYITHGNTRSGKLLDNQFRKDVVDFIYHLSREKQIGIELEEIFENSDNYVKIKNSQHSWLSESS